MGEGLGEDAHHPLPAIVSLAASGVQLVLARGATAFPEVVHWGSPVGDDLHEELHFAGRRGISPSALDEPWSETLVPMAADGYQGRPGVSLRDARGLLQLDWEFVDWQSSERESISVARADDVVMTVRVEMDDSGVVTVVSTVANDGDREIEVVHIEPVLPVSETVSEYMDFTGRWTKERVPQRAPLVFGSRLRTATRGRTGHDSPFVTIIGEEGFDASSGQVWGVHLAWSSDAIYRVDALPEARPMLGAGVLLQPGEVTLSPGEEFETPTAMFVYSDRGLDGVGDRFHRLVRTRRVPRRDAPLVTLNTWEALYFTHDLDRLATLADRAALVGVERFVLDDGWFSGRRSDTTALGDWTVDSRVWPDGLHPLVNRVRGLGMEFGLWLEPEMVSPDSQLAREHPDWVLGPAGRQGRTWRHQHVLDLARPEAFAHILSQLSALVEEYEIDYIKWDQNRDLLEAASCGTAGTVAHTRAVYALMDSLRSAFPSLEIESCASGGARVDLGVISRVDRFWGSDTNDPFERLAIQRWTELLIPPEYLGSHIGPECAHTTGRSSSLGSRIATALFGSLGIEWDLTMCGREDLDGLAQGIAAYKRLRDVLKTGRVVHLEADEEHSGTAIIADDGRSAIVRIAAVATSVRSAMAPVKVPMLKEGTYMIRPAEGIPLPEMVDLSPPPWLERGYARVTSRALSTAGIRLPLMKPGQSAVLTIEPAVGASSC